MLHKYLNFKILTLCILIVSSISCQCFGADVGMSIYTQNPTIFNGQTPTFVITARNYSTVGTALNVVVQVTDPNSTEGSFVTAYPSIGTFNTNTGQWSIPVINALSNATLNIVYKMKKSGSSSFMVTKFS